MYEFENLFEAQSDEPGLVLYQSFEEEFDAIRNRLKGMSAFSAEADDETYRNEILDAAKKVGVFVVDYTETVPYGRTTKEITTFFVLTPEESWRLPAYSVATAARRVRGMDDGLEHVISALLGYNEPQIAAWIDNQRRIRIGRHGTTLHLLIPETHYIRMKPLGYRCLDPYDTQSNIMVVFDREQRCLKPDARIELSPDLVIGRAAVTGDYYVSKLLEPYRERGLQNVESFEIVGPALCEFNLNIVSAIERFDGGCWKFDGARAVT